MEDVQGCDEELVCVLLFVASQVAGVRPDQVQQLEGNVRRALARVKLGWRGGEGEGGS